MAEVETLKQKSKFWIEVVAIMLSLIALGISVHSCENSDRSLGMAERESAPNIRIVQNLWAEEPRFELINESNSKLDNMLRPSYLIFIPSKIYYVIDGKEELSSLILSPVSYEAIEEQIISNQTNESIVTSYLPDSFYAKSGNRDIIVGEYLHLTEEMDIHVSTLPFLVIFSDVNYEYDGVSYRKIILSTPQGDIEITENDLNNIYDYVSETSKYLEVKVGDDDQSVYQNAHDNAEDVTEQIFVGESAVDSELLSVIGGTEGGYGYVLKKINDLISPTDPLSEHTMSKK